MLGSWAILFVIATPMVAGITLAAGRSAGERRRRRAAAGRVSRYSGYIADAVDGVLLLFAFCAWSAILVGLVASALP